MQRARKLSADPTLHPISEDGNTLDVLENDVFNSPRNSMCLVRSPPQLPTTGSCIDDRVKYVDEAITWIREELTDLKQKDKDLVNFYKHLMSTVTALKKMNTSFEKQRSIIHNMNPKVDPSPAIIDLTIIKPAIDEQRYKRIGQQDRNFSFS